MDVFYQNILSLLALLPTVFYCVLMDKCNILRVFVRYMIYIV